MLAGAFRWQACCCPAAASQRQGARTTHAGAASVATGSTAASSQARPQISELRRRDWLSGAALLAAAACWQPAAQAAGATGGEVGQYLPKAGIDDLVDFVPDGKKTPVCPLCEIAADRAASWKEERVANIQSGNFCVPRCDEPWTEVIFVSPAEGKIQLLVAPLRKLTNKAKAKISDIGSPEGVLQAVGPFLTGVSAPEEEEVLSAKSKDINGRQYYQYECNSLSGQTGPHILASCTTKGDQAYVFIVSANEKQWGKSKGKLQKVLDTFQA